MKTIPTFLAAVFAAVLTATVAAAGGKAGEPPPQVPDPVQLEAARGAAGRLLKTLGGELKAALGRGDLAAAVTACAESAPRIAREISLAEGWQVTRVSTKPRNSQLGTADAWAQQVMLDFERRLAAGADPATVEHAEVVVEPAGRYLRYAKAIPTQPMCLTCHGSVDSLAPALAASLATNYPHDRATGYTAGQLRGAVVVKAPLD
jgi:hypothetical protein